MKFDLASLSNTGGREANQDYVTFADQQSVGVWIVADGLGGHKGGEEASEIAARTVLETYLKQPALDGDIIGSQIAAAHEAVLEGQEREPRYGSMRTTIVALFRKGDEVTWVHVGDARLYHFRSGGIRFQTTDHTVPQMMVAAGEIEPSEIRFHEDRSRLLRAIGQEGNVKPEVATEPVQLHPGDAFLLCTDGFWEYVTETVMEVKLAQSHDAETWLSRMEEVLQDRAKGAHDNYSAMALIVVPAGSSKDTR